MNKIVVENNEFVSWLDGYLKGVNAASNGADRFSVNALFTKIRDGDPASLYMDFINNNEECEDLDIEFPPLRLSESRLIKGWEDFLSNKITSSFSGVDSALLDRVVYEALNIVSDLALDVGVDKVLRYSAEMGDRSGEYIFFSYPEQRFLILGFMGNRK